MNIDKNKLKLLFLHTPNKLRYDAICLINLHKHYKIVWVDMCLCNFVESEISSQLGSVNGPQHLVKKIVFEKLIMNTQSSMD